MNEETTQVVDKVLERIDILASKAGVTVEYLWPTYIKQATIEGIMMLVGVVVILAVCAITAVISYRFHKINVKEMEKRESTFSL